MIHKNKSTKDVFDIDSDYFHLKIKDLLEARELYHVHLMHKKNVVATAIGLYRIRKDDPWPDKRGSLHVHKRKKPKTGKTLENTHIRYYSWPCLLVFVDNWIQEDQFGKQIGKKKDVSWGDWIAPSIYMPDGRKVPVCVIQTSKTMPEPVPTGNYVFPSNIIGGGFPVLVDIQGQQRIASIGCLVTDGHLVYALTNRHVCGETGEIIYSIFGGNKVPIGRSSPKQVSRKLFTAIYPSWQGKDVYVNLDVGLIEIDNINLWTSQVYGIGKFNKMEDLSCENMSLKLIGTPVRAYGCASREMDGEIQAMFYRYKSEGGFEYVSDFLIGPRMDTKAKFQTHHGDSGTIWFLDTKDDRHLTPIAIQWGGQAFAGSGRNASMPYAMATCLSTVCNHLEIDIVADWAVDLPEYWGALGHYSIATLALDAIRNRKLKRLMTENLSRISFQLETLSKKAVSGLSKKDFVPLADVPDLVWKMGSYKRREADENPNHFADMDKPEPGTGKTLLEICEDKSKIDVKAWKKYYQAVEDESFGILPFRIWQIYGKMIQYLRKGKKEEFVCAAGILSHYVGDACQPLHISYRFDGDPDGDKEWRSVYDRKERTKVDKLVPISKGIHGDFDKVMVEYNTDKIQKNLPGLVQRRAKKAPNLVTGGRQAAEVAVDLMRRTFDNVNPKEACEEYVRYVGFKPKERSMKLWDRFGNNMQNVIADGALTLALLWESAWFEGRGDRTIDDLNAVDENDLAGIYIKKDFLRSCNIDTIERELAEGA
jgi:hypothetical protein